MLAVHFGAGNIGRGFIGQLLYESGYEICFLDVNQTVIDDINNLGKYRIKLVGDTPKFIEVENISAVNSNDIDLVVKKIVQADIITTALGVNILKYIAPVIAKGINERIIKNKKPLNIIACENMIGASSKLEELVYKHFDELKIKELKKYISFPNSAVDRIVPIQNNEEKLLVETEEFFEWDIDGSNIIGSKPNICGVTYVDNLQAYIERKLFAVNATHASIAYLGYMYGKKTVYEATQDKKIMEIVRQVTKETSKLLVKKYSFDLEKHQAYINKIIQRFSSKYISDDILRVARSPIRKIGENERLIAPAKQLLENNIEPVALSTVIACALHFKNDKDVEAKELQDFILQNGVEEALEKYSKLNGNSRLVQLIVKKYNELK